MGTQDALSLTPYRLSHAWFCLVIVSSLSYFWIHQHIEHSYNTDTNLADVVSHMRRIYRPEISHEMRESALSLATQLGNTDLLHWLDMGTDDQVRPHTDLVAHISLIAPPPTDGGEEAVSFTYRDDLEALSQELKQSWQTKFGSNLHISSKRLAHIRLSDKTPLKSVSSDDKKNVTFLYDVEDIVDLEQANAGWLPALTYTPNFHFIVLVPGPHCRPLFFREDEHQWKTTAFYKGWGALTIWNGRLPIAMPSIIHSFNRNLIKHVLGDQVPLFEEHGKDLCENQSTVDFSGDMGLQQCPSFTKDVEAVQLRYMGVLLQSIQNEFLDTVNLLNTSKGEIMNEDASFWEPLRNSVYQMEVLYKDLDRHEGNFPAALLRTAVESWRNISQCKTSIRRRSYAPVDYYMSIYIPPWVPLLLAVILSLLSLYRFRLRSPG